MQVTIIYTCVETESYLSENLIGFDPIFFLHHANVDRLLSLWVAINPGFEFTSGSSEKGTWTIKANSTVDDRTRKYPTVPPINPQWLMKS